jgi:ferredoxin
MTTQRGGTNETKETNMNPPTMNPVSAIAPAAGGLPKLMLVAPDGARAEIYLYCAYCVAYCPYDVLSMEEIPSAVRLG